jgi:hypothetical protein
LFDERSIPITDKIDHEAFSACTCRSANTVKIAFYLIGQVIVDDTPYMLDV